MLGLVEVLLCDEHTLTEEVLVDLLAVGLGNQPATAISSLSFGNNHRISYILAVLVAVEEDVVLLRRRRSCCWNLKTSSKLKSRMRDCARR